MRQRVFDWLARLADWSSPTVVHQEDGEQWVSWGESQIPGLDWLLAKLWLRGWEA